MKNPYIKQWGPVVNLGGGGKHNRSTISFSFQTVWTLCSVTIELTDLLQLDELHLKRYGG